MGWVHIPHTLHVKLSGNFSNKTHIEMTQEIHIIFIHPRDSMIHFTSLKGGVKAVSTHKNRLCWSYVLNYILWYGELYRIKLIIVYAVIFTILKYSSYSI